MRARALAVGLATATALLVAVAPAAAQSVRLVPFGGQSFNMPLHVAAPPGDFSRVFVAEGGGIIRLVKDGATRGTPFLNISGSVCTTAEGCGNEGGLVSMAFAPDYATSGRFYVFYTRASTTPGVSYYMRVEEFRRSASNPDLADVFSRRIVLEIPSVGPLPLAEHDGGQLQFGLGGRLFISTGDALCCGDPLGLAQNIDTLQGKLLRIDPTGAAPGQYSIPAGNPFAGPAFGRDEIYSYGLRQPYRFSFDRVTGDLALGDVGEGLWEEIDFMPRGTFSGANFGWDCFEGNHVFDSPSPSCTSTPGDYVAPVLEYANPEPGSAAVIGGYVIRDPALPSSLAGRYIYADNISALGDQLRTVRLFAGGSSGDSGLGLYADGVVSFGEDACAHIYVATLGGTVYRLQPTSGTFQCGPPPPPSPPPPPPSGTPAAGGEPSPAEASPACYGTPATIVGTEGSDVRSGTPAADVIAGLGGNDRLSGLAGDDLVCGGPGKDTVRGGKGMDTLYGEAGKDSLKGGPGKDKLRGGRGKDTQVQ